MASDREHPSLASSVRRGVELEIARIEQRAKPFEIWEGRDVSPIDGSRSTHTAPVLLMRVAVLGKAAIHYVTRRVGIQ